MDASGDASHRTASLRLMALAIDVVGIKFPRAVVEDDTENATVVKRLLVGLPSRGLDATKPTLFVLGRSKALPPANKGGIRPPCDRSA